MTWAPSLERAQLRGPTAYALGGCRSLSLRTPILLQKVTTK